jgi:hypothetical protein
MGPKLASRIAREGFYAYAFLYFAGIAASSAVAVSVCICCLLDLAVAGRLACIAASRDLWAGSGSIADPYRSRVRSAFRIVLVWV